MIRIIHLLHYVSVAKNVQIYQLRVILLLEFVIIIETRRATVSTSTLVDMRPR
jgi:hypothetical protein